MLNANCDLQLFIFKNKTLYSLKRKEKANKCSEFIKHKEM